MKSLKQPIAELTKEIEDHEKKLRELNNAKKALQSVCRHEWEPDGHDSHYDYETCKICGLTDRC